MNHDHLRKLKTGPKKETHNPVF